MVAYQVSALFAPGLILVVIQLLGWTGNAEEIEARRYIGAQTYHFLIARICFFIPH